MHVIETNVLTKYYGKARGIINLNLSVEEGDFFGFIGPNGAGKSTTIRTLVGLTQKTSGSARIFGKDIEQDKEKILADIGYMPSEAMFYPGMKVRDIIKLSADLHKKDCRKQAVQLCEQLQLDTSRKIDELSLGNRKKVSIVCAMQHNPRLYILDEPTSGLDPLMQKEFFTLLKERHKTGATLFLSSHILSEIQRNCNRAAIIREGQIIACNRVENLTQTNTKHVTVHGITSLPDIPNIRNLQTISDGFSFLFQGEISVLLQILSRINLTDVNIADPDLEEIFLHYYAKGGNLS
ncbi:MAG: ABC transporter ATP-binding protein [Oliverpabstia sp.]|nr:ABC transporter ATP-binding protein [Oliverpabstia sp.]